MDELEGQPCMTPRDARRVSQQSPASFHQAHTPNLPGSASPLAKKHRWREGRWTPPPSPSKTDCVGKCVLCLLINAIFIFGIFVAFLIGHWASKGRFPWGSGLLQDVSQWVGASQVWGIVLPLKGLTDNNATNHTHNNNNSSLTAESRAAGASSLYLLHNRLGTNASGAHYNSVPNQEDGAVLNAGYELQRSHAEANRVPHLREIYPPSALSIGGSDYYESGAYNKEQHMPDPNRPELTAAHLGHKGNAQGHLVPLPRDVLPTHYDLQLDFSEVIDQQHIRGNVSIALDAFGNATDDELVFHAAANIFIHRIRLRKKGTSLNSSASCSQLVDMCGL